MKMMKKMKQYDFVRTCIACPEQYDIYDGDELVAYFRYRWGHYKVHPYSKDKFYIKEWWETEPERMPDFDTVIYEESIGGSYDGSFDPDVRDEVLKRVNEKLNEYFNNDTV